MHSEPNSHPADCDVLVVGGGINGVAIARDLAGRGVRVTLCEQDDLAQHTSSCSSKMIHGGIRYLENREFMLVRKALAERETLLRSAPHIMRPLRLVVPNDPAVRPAWMLRAGFMLYDCLASRQFLPSHQRLDLRTHEAGAPLRERFPTGFAYSDGWADDARLVVLNAMDAAERGATILTRTQCVDAQRTRNGWSVLLDSAGGLKRRIRARALVNATGAWAARFLDERAHQRAGRSLRLVKGSHVVVPRLYDHPFAYAFQSPDKRVIFTFPYEGRFTLIGTTEMEHTGAPDKVSIAASEASYLCEQISRYFRKSLQPSDIVWSYSGVRPLLDDGSANASKVTRDYAVELDTRDAPLLTVWGGKLTTHRKLGEEAAALLCKALNLPGRRWTASGVTLPGGDMAARVDADCTQEALPGVYAQLLSFKRPWLPRAMCQRFATTYGTRCETLLDGAKQISDLGRELLPGFYEAEARYLKRHEWAHTLDDVVWRRTKLGLHHTRSDLERAAQEF